MDDSKEAWRMTKRVFWMSLACVVGQVAWVVVHSGNRTWAAARWLKAKRDAL